MLLLANHGDGLVFCRHIRYRVGRRPLDVSIIGDVLLAAHDGNCWRSLLLFFGKGKSSLNGASLPWVKSPRAEQVAIAVPSSAFKNAR